MSGESIFISYANADRPRVEVLIKTLENQGLDVWWDRDIPRGKNFNRVIEQALQGEVRNRHLVRHVDRLGVGVQRGVRGPHDQPFTARYVKLELSSWQAGGVSTICIKPFGGLTGIVAAPISINE